MAAPSGSSASANPIPTPEADQVFEALGFSSRRLLFQSLAMKGSVTAAEVVPEGRLKRDATSKQLQELVRAGLASMSPDIADARRMRYTLNPHLKPTQFPDGHWELDFGFCLLRWR